MLGYNRTIRRTNINVFINIGPGAGEEGKEEVKRATFPTLLTMIVGKTKPEMNLPPESFDEFALGKSLLPR